MTSSSSLLHESRMAPDDPRAHRLERIETFGGADQFVLPYRQLGELRQFAWIGFGIGLFVLLFMIGWISGPLAIGIGMVMKGLWFGWIPIAFSFFGIVGLRVAFLLLVGSQAVLQNKTRSVVSLNGNRLCVTEEFFRFKWHRKFKLDQIRKLRIVDKIDDDRNSLSPAVLGDYSAALEARSDDRKSFPLVCIYPRELLVELAENLATELNRANSDQSGDFGPLTIERGFKDNVNTETNGSSRFGASTGRQTKPTVEVVDAVDRLLEPVEQPKSSTAALTKHDSGIQITVPPMGFKGAPGFLFGFGVLWTAISTFFLFLVISGGVDGEVWVAALVVGVLEAIGIGMLVAGCNGAKKRTVIVTAGEQLMVISESLLGKKRQQWTKPEIVELCVGPSNTEVNDQTLYELQIHHDNGSQTGLLLDRDDDELDWIAWELNSNLGLKPSGIRTIRPTVLPQDEAGHYLPHVSSLASVEHFGTATQITIPPRGFRPFLGLFSTGTIFIVVSIGAAFFVWNGDLVDMFLPVPICILFSAIGAWANVYGYILAQRGYVFDVSPERLHVTLTGFMSNKSYDFSIESIRSADIVDSGVKVNSRSIQQLGIKGAQQQFCGMTDHSHEDLSLVALTIQQAMSLRSS